MSKVVKIELDKERNLIYDFRAVRDFEKVTGKNILKPDTWENLSGTDVSVMLWACLKVDEPALTIDDVAALLNMENMKYCMEKIIEASGTNQSPLAGSLTS